MFLKPFLLKKTQPKFKILKKKCIKQDTILCKLKYSCKIDCLKTHKKHVSC